MPHSRTILRASSVLPTRSLLAPGGEVAVDEELGGAAAHAHGQRVLDHLAGVDVALLDGQLLGHAQRQPGREDGDLVHGVGVLEHVGEHGVAALVEGDALLLGLRQHEALAALAHEHPVAGRLEVLHGRPGASPAARRGAPPR